MFANQIDSEIECFVFKPPLYIIRGFYIERVINNKFVFTRKSKNSKNSESQEYN